MFSCSKHQVGLIAVHYKPMPMLDQGLSLSPVNYIQAGSKNAEC
jgi:hypothetical protein